MGTMTTERTMTTLPSPTGLYWNERGAVACAGHTPFQGSDTWAWERWAPLPLEAVGGFRDLGVESKCEICGIAVREHPPC